MVGWRIGGSQVGILLFVELMVYKMEEYLNSWTPNLKAKFTTIY